MGAIILKDAIKKRPGFLYYVDSNGDVYEAVMSKTNLKPGEPRKTLIAHVERKSGSLYYVDGKGNVCEAKMSRETLEGEQNGEKEGDKEHSKEDSGENQEEDSKILVENAVKRERGYLYIVDGKGNVCRTPFKSGEERKYNRENYEILLKNAVKRRQGFLYYIDGIGNVCESRISRESDGEKYPARDNKKEDSISKVLKEKAIVRKPGYFYTIDDEGSIIETKLGSNSDDKILLKNLIKKKDGYVYNIDSRGNILETPIKKGTSKLKVKIDSKIELSKKEIEFLVNDFRRELKTRIKEDYKGQNEMEEKVVEELENNNITQGTIDFLDAFLEQAEDIYDGEELEIAKSIYEKISR